MHRAQTLSLLAASALLVGCYSPGGGIYPRSGGGYTYVSSEMRPVTITVIDTRTEKPFFKLDIPPGKQLTMNFIEGMVYAIWDAGTANGRLTNQLTCPPLGSRRIDYSLRTAPEWREEPPSYVDKIGGTDPKPAWWTPQGGELPKRTRYYE